MEGQDCELEIGVLVQGFSLRAVQGGLAHSPALKARPRIDPVLVPSRARVRLRVRTTSSRQGLQWAGQRCPQDSLVRNEFLVPAQSLLFRGRFSFSRILSLGCNIQLIFLLGEADLFFVSCYHQTRHFCYDIK